MTFCRCCGKHLTDPVSVALGIGPVCRMNGKLSDMRNASLFGLKATYEAGVCDGVLCLIDLDEGASVTNAAESVIKELAEQGHDLTLPVIYRDTMGVWDQLLVKDGAFAGFKSINETDRAAAIAKVKNLKE